jgi:hypothetical protein
VLCKSPTTVLCPVCTTKKRLSAISASFVRLSQTHKAVQLNADTTCIMADLYMWTLVEAGVGLTCSCLPVIGPLFALIRDKMTLYMVPRSLRKGIDDFNEASLGHLRSQVVGHLIDSETELSKNSRGIMRTDGFVMEIQMRRENDSTGDNTFPRSSHASPV